MKNGKFPSCLTDSGGDGQMAIMKGPSGWAVLALALLGCGSSGYGGPMGAGDLPDGGMPEPGDGNGGPPDLSPIGPVDLGLGGETQMAIAGSRVVVAWIGAQALGYALSLDRGATFAVSSAIREVPFGDPVAAATPDGSLFVGGLGACAGACGGRVAVARSPSGSTTFQPAVMIDNAHFVDHPWLTAASDGRLTLVYNPRDFTQNPPAFKGSGMTAATSTTGQTWETHDIVPFDMERDVAIATGSVDGMERYALFYDTDAPFGSTLEKSADGKAWSPTATISGRVSAYLGDAIRSASRGADVWLLYGLAGYLGGSESAIVYDQGIALGHSADGGATWDAPAIILQDDRKVMLPELVIEKDGALDVVYYAGIRELDPAGTFEWIRSTDEGKTWSSAVVIKRGILFQPSRTTQDWLGDYVAVATDDDFAYFAWTSNETGQATAQFARRPLPKP